jgi:hypothetical protein
MHLKNICDLNSSSTIIEHEANMVGVKFALNRFPCEKTCGLKIVTQEA